MPSCRCSTGASGSGLIQTCSLAGAPLTDAQKTFLYEFAVWIYRALAQFKARHPDTQTVWSRRERQSGAFRRAYVTNTLLDVILALRRFHRDNRDYILFKVKERHSGASRISWPRTIAKAIALVQEGRPLYLDPRVKRCVVDFDKELLVIFYSILGYVRDRFGFPVQIDMGYELIAGARFARYLAGYGVTRLRAIRYKYFSDRERTLWQLCYAFFDRAHKANVVASDEEYLLAKNFEIVFEEMIDSLVGGDVAVAKLRELSDGKTIDHLYLDESLTTRRDADGAARSAHRADVCLPAHEPGRRVQGRPRTRRTRSDDAWRSAGGVPCVRGSRPAVCVVLRLAGRVSPARRCSLLRCYRIGCRRRSRGDRPTVG